MKFRNKILVAIWGVVLGLLVLTFVAINYWIRVQVQSRFSDDLRRNYSTLREITTLHADQDLKSCQIVSETPRLKAVTELGDRNTVVQLAKELNSGILANLFIVTDTSGHPLVQLVDTGQVELQENGMPSIMAALQKKSATDVWRNGSEVYRVASCPVITGTDLLGTLTIGYRLKREDVEFIKALTNSEVTLAVDSQQVLSTMPPSAMNSPDLIASLSASGDMSGGQNAGVFRFESARESYVGTFFPLSHDQSRLPRIRFLLFKSINKEVESTLHPVLNTLIVLSIIVLLITAVIGYVISSSITKPIAALVEGTTEVSRGNYDIRINVNTGGELKFLARKFEDMGLSLKEKVNELARQNVELQRTLGELKKTQEERLRLATNLHLLLESTSEGIFGVDVAGRCTFLNRAGAQMLGYSQLEVFGRNMHQLIQGARQDGNPYPFSESPIAKVLATGEGCRIDGEVMWRRDGSALPVEYSSSPIVDNGKIQGAVVAFMDVTERRMLQQQLMQTQKIESIGRLAGGIAHDFNNILTIIVGHASLLKRLPPDSPKRPESVVAVEKAAQRGAGLVRQLLTFARKTDVMLESVRLNEVIAEVAKLINETFPKTIIIAMRLESNLPPIHADANQLHQVLVNLCVNARDAMPEGGTLSIGTSQVPLEKVRSKYSAASASEYVEISVTDSGTGMDEQTLNRIFEPFFTTKEVGKGTGLGLAVVFGIVETHKGFIGVESAVGKGTTFHLYFPVQSRTVEERAATEAELVDIPGGSETILVVEDEQMLRELLFGTLTGKGYNVLLAEDGQEMISQYVTHQERISLVISDMGLPKVGGYEAFKKIRSVDPSAKVVLASGYLEPNVKSEILRSGARDFIQKPYSPEEVLKKVREIIDTDAQRS